MKKDKNSQPNDSSTSSTSTTRIESSKKLSTFSILEKYRDENSVSKNNETPMVFHPPSRF